MILNPNPIPAKSNFDVDDITADVTIKYSSMIPTRSLVKNVCQMSRSRDITITSLTCIVQRRNKYWQNVLLTGQLTEMVKLQY